MKNEKIYESAKIEILTLEGEDVICTSVSASIELPDIDLSEI